jgi:hypothetical protein
VICSTKKPNNLANFPKELDNRHHIHRGASRVDLKLRAALESKEQNHGITRGLEEPLSLVSVVEDGLGAVYDVAACPRLALRP